MGKNCGQVRIAWLQEVATNHHHTGEFFGTGNGPLQDLVDMGCPAEQTAHLRITGPVVGEPLQDRQSLLSTLELHMQVSEVFLGLVALKQVAHRIHFPIQCCVMHLPVLFDEVLDRHREGNFTTLQHLSHSSLKAGLDTFGRLLESLQHGIANQL